MLLQILRSTDGLIMKSTTLDTYSVLMSHLRAINL